MRTSIVASLLTLTLVLSISAQQSAPQSTWRPKTGPAPTLVPPGAPAPTREQAARIAEVIEFEKEMEQAVVRGRYCVPRAGPGADVPLHSRRRMD